MTSIVTFNVNGLRSAGSKGLTTWIQDHNADIYCFQEIKVNDIPTADAVLNHPEYFNYYYFATKKGYSGVGISTRIKPNHIEYGCGHELYDFEGRIIRLDFDNFSLMNVYFPSGTSGEERQSVKDDFLIFFNSYIQTIIQQFPNLIIVGDINIAHTELDIHNAKSNKKSSGFLPHEREWLTEFLKEYFVDAFRKLNGEEKIYSWWSYRANARTNNKGWRIDYQFVTKPIEDKINEATCLNEVVFSDHCPVFVKYDL